MTTTPQDFREAVDKVCADFNWVTHAFTRDDEFAVLCELEGDEHFEQILWILNTQRNTFRCLVTSRMEVPPGKTSTLLELCARINDGLGFGCAEFSFADQQVVFRDGADLQGQGLEDIVSVTSARLFSMAMRYGPAVNRVLAGDAPAEAVARVEANSKQ